MRSTTIVEAGPGPSLGSRVLERAAPELRALTGARGIAAWLVVLFHIRGAIAGLPPRAEQMLAKGYLAVDFFFLLSGFVIWLAWHERLRDPRAIPAFLTKRFARVWPLHAVILVVAVIVVLAQGVLGHPTGADFPFADLPFHVLLLQDWGTVSPLTWNVPAWSISAEMAAYLLFPLLVLAIDWRHRSTAIVLAGVAIPSALLAVMMRAEPMLGQDIARFGVLRCTTEFAAGTAVAALWWRWQGIVPAWWPAATAMVGVAALAAGVPETIAIPALFATLLLALALSSGTAANLFENRLVHRLGTVSYATYLSHYVLWYAFKLIAVRDLAAVPRFHIALYLLLVLIASNLLHDHVERPAQRWIAGRHGRRPGFR